MKLSNQPVHRVEGLNPAVLRTLVIMIPMRRDSGISPAANQLFVRVEAELLMR